MKMYCFFNPDVQSLCRICFQKGDEDLFSAPNQPKDVVNKLFECFQICITYDSRKPCAICKNCLKELHLIVSFRLKCLTIDDRFENYCKALLSNNTLKEEANINNMLNFEETTALDHVYSESNDIINLSCFGTEISDYVFKTDAEDKSFKCSKCDKILKSKISLMKHNVSMHEKRKHVGRVSGFGAARRYHCTVCSYSTPHSQTLVNHIRRHNGEKPYSCECGKSFTQSSSLAAHRKTHSATTYFTCSLCGKQFKHDFAMKNHLRVHDAGSYSCSICFKVLKSKQSLKAHMRRHYNICNYNCEECGDTFITSSELLNHRQKHNLEKKVECHLCGYKTHTKKNLINHIKRHTGNRTFKCNMCQVAFYTQNNLQRHQRVHTRDKPFSCPTCCQKFAYSPSLNKHMKTVHGINYKWADFKTKETKIMKLPLNSFNTDNYLK